MSPSPARLTVLQHFSEAEWQAQVIRWARRLRWLAYHTHDARHSASGFPDLVLVKPPRVIFAELKTETAPEPRGEQKRWGDALRACPDVEYFVWRPRDERDVLDTLAVEA
jgi:hypothetical protein